MSSISFRHITSIEFPNVMEMIKQPILKNPKGEYHDEKWIIKLINEGYAIGGYLNDKLISFVIGEELIDKGVMIWFVIVDQKYQNKGYGTQTLNEFELFLKSIKKEWVFLNAVPTSLNFYNKNKYSTCEYSQVYEHLKYL